MTSRYREDIGGLRALAVLSVIGFHFETLRVFGGFVGVDIFFVISGFLITGIIQKETRDGTFSFGRAHLRHADARPEDFVLSDIFALEGKMKAALPAHKGFSYVSVVDAVCPARQCPLSIGGGIPLAWDHAHLTAEGSVYVMERLAPMLGLGK
jgi:hypothetical protein